MMNLNKLRNLSKKQIGYLGAFVGIVGVLAWAFISAGVITHNFNRDNIIGTENRQELDVNSIILTETKQGKKYWEIYGETGYYNSDNNVAILDHVTGNFYKENDVAMSFESSKGTYNEKKKQIILYNNTKIVLKDGTILNTDRLIWSGSDKEIVAKGHVKITKNKDFIATADKATISPDYETFRIVGHSVTKLYDLKEK